MSKDKPMKEEFKTVRCREDVHHHLKKFVKKHPEVKVSDLIHYNIVVNYNCLHV